MKALVIGVAVLWLFMATVDVAYNVGQQESRKFAALCQTPGVRCVVQFDPVWLRRHSEVDVLPYVTYEFAGLPWESR
jgi:hypothetical protein